MINEFFQSQEPLANQELLRSLVGLFIVLLGTFVGVEIRVGKDEEDV